MQSPSQSWILLTMGDRPDELAAAVASIPRDGHEIIVVTNGAPGAVLPDGVIRIDLAENVGIPAGRNEGAARATGDTLVFLDDDAQVAPGDGVGRALTRFDTEPDLAVVGFRIADPATGATARRHVPRLGRSDPSRSGDVTSFLGGAVAIRRAAFESVGGLPAAFFYSLEETDLAWRLLDAGWRVAYDADAVVHHPPTSIARHAEGARRTARNRVLMARRLLPAPLAPIYVTTWFVLSLVRSRTLGPLLDGTRDGLRAEVDRQPIAWRTVLTMTRLGRPPII